jgi:hypothetical protein
VGGGRGGGGVEGVVGRTGETYADDSSRSDMPSLSRSLRLAPPCSPYLLCRASAKELRRQAMLTSPRACQDDIRGVTVVAPYVPPPPPPTPPPVDAAAAPDAAAPAAAPDPAAATKGDEEGGDKGLVGGDDVDVADPAVHVR